ncbi:MAG: hypothetical protein D6820_10360, partial [Lentisphaerae bacterium]
YNLWNTNSFDVGVSWTLGASGYALSYDLLFNDMTPQQRELVRKAIATGTRGRRSYGADLPKSFAASNHYGYHGDLAVLLCSIEDEEGFDVQTFETIKRVLLNYWEVGFTRKGACHEDGYGPNLGLRAGSRGLFVLARRGTNIFDTAKYRHFIRYFALEFEPFPGGAFTGGASGAYYQDFYPTCALVAHYLYPHSPATNFILRQICGDDFSRPFRWQGWLDYMLFGCDLEGPQSREELLKQSGLPLSVYYPERGKVVARSDWSDDALHVTLDARPDAFLIGHDKVDRGTFTLSALGRTFAFSGDFHWFNTSQENSLVHIDGKAEAWKAPSVKMVSYHDDGEHVSAVADLKYAYDWQWTPPWPKVEATYKSPWEPERSDPRQLGWPEEVETGWLPRQIFASDTGYAWPNGMRRRPYNPVKYAIRSVFLQRRPHPFVVIRDEYRKDDDSPHHFQWYMQMLKDMKIIRHSGRDIILGGDDHQQRRLLVRVLRADGLKPFTVKCERYVAAEDPKRKQKKEASRLIISVQSRDPKFLILLYPFRPQQMPLPETRLEQNVLTVHVGDTETQVVIPTELTQPLSTRR